MGSSASSSPARILGRYALFEEIASGGMATVHFGRLLGVVGFAKTVAIKRLHPQLARDPEFVSMFLDEARLAARIRHPNVVSTLDVVALEGELFLVMEYVQGESLRQIERTATEQGVRIPPPIVATILVGVLHGLHAAHEATNEHGEALGIVHRDVSPQNVLVGVDGVPRVFDFGVAKAAGRAQTTREGQLKGKLAYMSPEQLMGIAIERPSDIFAASAVLWEALVGRRLFKGDSEGEVVRKVLDAQVERPSKLVPELPPQLDAIVLRGLARNPSDRFATAREMARALEKCIPLAPASEVGEYVEKLAAKTLSQRAERMAQIESTSTFYSRAHVLTGTSANPASVTVSMSGAARPAASAAPAKERLAPQATPEKAQADQSSALGAIVSEPFPAWGAGELAFLRMRRVTLRRAVAASAALACALMLVALGASLRTPPETRAAAALVAPLAAPPRLEPATPPATEAPAPPAALSARTPAAQMPAMAAASADPAAAPAALPKAQAGPVPRPARRRASSSCDPPFTVDANGYRHYKLECAQ
jgi:serine/threonine-protein kinase